MKKVAFFMALMGVVVVGLVLPHARIREVPRGSLGELMAAFHEDGQRHGINSPFNGVVLVARNDGIVFHEAFGVADDPSGTPLALDSRFLIGSVSKSFTAMLVLQQVERGVLSLDQSVAELLPWYSCDRADALTLERLLSHTAGLHHYTGLHEIDQSRTGFYHEALTPREYAELIAQIPFAYEPGTGYRYSSFGYVLLAVVLEEVTGKSYPELLREHITDPLGLADTGFAGNDFVAEHVVADYRFDRFGIGRALFLGSGGELDPARFRDQSTAYATAGIHSTAADLLRFTQALRDHELLAPELSRAMATPNDWGYGYGLLRNPRSMLSENPQATLTAHGGQVTGYTAFVGMYDDGTTIVVLANVAPLDIEDVVREIHLVANGKTLVKEPIHPSLRNLRKFDGEGGMPAFLEYYDVMTERAGYPYCPSAGTLSHVVGMHLASDRDDEAREATDTLGARCAARDEELLNSTGYAWMRNDRFEPAVAVLTLNAELFPDSANVYDSLGDGFEQAGDLENARDSYTRAVELGRLHDDPALGIYERKLERMN